MKKIGLLLLTLAMLFLAGCGNGAADDKTPSADGADDTKVYEFKMANQAPVEDVQYESFEYLAKLLNERSGGRIKATHYGNNTMGSSNQEQLEMLLTGVLEFTTVPGFVFATIDSSLKEFNVTDYPYLFDDRAEYTKFLDSDIAARMRDKAGEKLGVYVKPAFLMGWMNMTSNHPMDTLEDIKGMKIRSSQSEMYVAILSKWGVSPTPVTWTETYTAMQQKTVDGCTTLTPLNIYQKFYEVQKYLSVVNFSGMAHYPVISKTWYDSLPADLQEVVDSCMADYQVKTRELHEFVETDSIKVLEEKGMTVKTFTEEEFAPWKELAVPVWEERADLAGEEILKEVRTYLGK